MSMQLNLTLNVHLIENQLFTKNCYLISGDCEYYHYLCDGFDDRVIENLNIFYNSNNNNSIYL